MPLANRQQEAQILSKITQLQLRLKVALQMEVVWIVNTPRNNGIGPTETLAVESSGDYNMSILRYFSK